VIPEQDYVAVIFTNTRTGFDDDGYQAMAARMDELARRQPGYLGVDSVRAADGHGITVSYWRTADDALAWKRVAEHTEARAIGRDRWYEQYTLRVARVEREYSFRRGESDLVHVALPDEWQAAQASGTYERSTRGVSLAEEGFIHCAFGHQLDGVLAAFYADVDDVVLLTIDADRVGSPIVVEDVYGAGEAFPHLYGPLPVSAVIRAEHHRPTRRA
jgi:uncharacterized protein (DUF952 family)/heme-degrading monooxygenase HmoA